MTQYFKFQILRFFAPKCEGTGGKKGSTSVHARSCYALIYTDFFCPLAFFRNTEREKHCSIGFCFWKPLHQLVLWRLMNIVQICCCCWFPFSFEELLEKLKARIAHPLRMLNQYFRRSYLSLFVPESVHPSLFWTFWSVLQTHRPAKASLKLKRIDK